MVNIANDTNKGFLLAVVLVLALAIFSGSLRDRYSSGYAVASSSGVNYYENAPGSDFGSRSPASRTIVEECNPLIEVDYDRYVKCRNEALKLYRIK